MTVAIDYVIGKNPEYLKEVFGLQVAIFNWIKAFFRYGSQEKITFLIDDVKAWNEVEDVAKEVGLDPVGIARSVRAALEQVREVPAEATPSRRAVPQMQ